jgi:hypothetical protein
VAATAAVAVAQPDNTTTASSIAQEKANTAAETATATAAAVVAAVEQSAAASAKIEQLEAKVEQQRAVLRLYQQLSSLVIAIKPAANDEAPTKVLAHLHLTVKVLLNVLHYCSLLLLWYASTSAMVCNSTTKAGHVLHLSCLPTHTTVCFTCNGTQAECTAVNHLHRRAAKFELELPTGEDDEV